MTAETPLDGVGEAALARLARVADRLAWNRERRGGRGRELRDRPGRAHEFLDFRDYTPGDDPRLIDWRASARQPHPLVRRNRSDAGGAWWICLDRSASMGVDPAKWALAVQLAAAFAFLLLHRDYRTGLLLFSSGIDDAVVAGRGRAQYGHIAEHLAATAPLAEGGGTSAAACLARLPRAASVFVVSDFLVAGGLHDDLARLQRTGGELHALQVLAAEECPLPEPGVPLRDVESGALRQPAEPGAARDAARVALQRHADALAAFCRRRGIVHSRCTPRLDWSAAASAHLAGIGRRAA